MLIEAQSADHVIRNAPAHQRLFDNSRLRVDSVEHHDLGRVGAALGGEPPDFARDEVSLVAFGHAGKVGDQFARGVLGPQALFLALAIVADDRVGGGQDGFGRAVVLLELEDARLGKVALEVQDVANVGAAPAVDRLVLVADHAQVRAAGRKRAHQQILHAVGVLVFVDQQMLRARLPSQQHARVALEDLVYVQQQVAEVHRVHRAQPFAIEPVNRRQRSVAAVAAGAFGECCGTDGVIL